MFDLIVYADKVQLIKNISAYKELTPPVFRRVLLTGNVRDTSTLRVSPEGFGQRKEAVVNYIYRGPNYTQVTSELYLIGSGSMHGI